MGPNEHSPRRRSEHLENLKQRLGQQVRLAVDDGVGLVDISLACIHLALATVRASGCSREMATDLWARVVLQIYPEPPPVADPPGYRINFGEEDF